MKIVKQLIYVLFISAIVISCSDDTVQQFQGDVNVTLVSKGSKEGVEGEAKDFVFDVFLSRSFNSDINLTFDLKDISSFPNLLSVSSVKINKNETKGTLTISSIKKADIDNILTGTQNFEIILSSFSGITNTIKLASNEVIIMKPEEGFLPLTKAQKELIAHYKTKGINLTPWIGKIPVEVKVKTAANGSFAPFLTEQNLTYTGVTHITLSENATREKPLLKMTKNAFGLAEYLQYVFRHETILNTGFWYNPSDPNTNPAGDKIFALLGDQRMKKWKNKEYSFDVSVNDIEFKADKSIVFVRKNGSHTGYSNFLTTPSNVDKTSAINFEYTFPLWDELFELAKGNTESIKHIESGGSVHPNKYIGPTGILEDGWGETNWVTPKGAYDNTAKEMNFKFNTDHASSGDYDIVTVKYKVQ